MGSLFKPEDINTLIKIFAYGIQERFDEIEGYSPTGHHPFADDAAYFAAKYRSYRTADPVELRYLQKLTVRIIQILDFFKERSKNAHLLSCAVRKIEQKLNHLVSFQPVEVGDLFTFVLDLSQYGFSIKRSFIRQRRLSHKKMEPIVPPHENAPPKLKDTLPDSSLTEPVRKPRAMSHSAKQRPQNSGICKEPLQTQLSRIYGILDVQVGYNLRVAENRQRYQRECLRQNNQISMSRKAFEKEWGRRKQKIEIQSLRQKGQGNPLKEKMEGNPLKEKMEGNPLKELNNGLMKPVLNNWVSRKRRFSENKRRPFERENISRI